MTKCWLAKWLISSHFCTRGKLIDWNETKERENISRFFQISEAKLSDKLEGSGLSWIHSSNPIVLYVLQKMLQATIYTKFLGKCWSCIDKTSNIHPESRPELGFCWAISTKKSDLIRLTLESFKSVLDRNIQNFSKSLRKGKGQCQVALSELIYPSIYQNVVEVNTFLQLAQAAKKIAKCKSSSTNKPVIRRSAGICAFKRYTRTWRLVLSISVNGK